MHMSLRDLREIDCTQEHNHLDIFEYTNTHEWMYFVASRKNRPQKIFFDYVKALKLNSKYSRIDVFDKFGDKVMSFKNSNGTWVEDINNISKLN